MSWTKEGSRRGGLKSAMRTRGTTKHAARNNRIASAAMAGRSVSNIAGDFGLTTQSIYYILKRMGVKWQRRGAGPNFPCGHPRSKENTLMNGSARCVECHRAAARRWYNPKNPTKPLYARPTCELAKVW